MPCAKFHSDHFTATWMRAEWNFNRIELRWKKSFVKWAPDRRNYSSKPKRWCCLVNLCWYKRSRIIKIKCQHEIVIFALLSGSISEPASDNHANTAFNSGNTIPVPPTHSYPYDLTIRHSITGFKWTPLFTPFGQHWDVLDGVTQKWPTRAYNIWGGFY